ncbi:MAG: ribosome-associated translation inhibitor RaiA [Gammaproteobacteria bacterium]|nr:ribosome-associated translation inhibitor RaiA [Gammaproteobacteria bacterium]
MQINITGHHLEITPALRSYVENKLNRVIRHFDHVVDAHVVLTLEKQGNKAETTIQVSGTTLHAVAGHQDMYAAIDEVADKLDRQVKRYKEKLTDHHRREGGLKAQ